MLLFSLLAFLFIFVDYDRITFACVLKVKQMRAVAFCLPSSSCSSYIQSAAVHMTLQLLHLLRDAVGLWWTQSCNHSEAEITVILTQQREGNSTFRA